MNKSEFISILKRGLENRHLNPVILKGLDIVDCPDQFTYQDQRPHQGMPVDEILALDRFRYRVSLEQGEMPTEGLRETIHSLSDTSSERIWIVLALPSAERGTGVCLLVDRETRPVGCTLDKCHKGGRLVPTSSN